MNSKKVRTLFSAALVCIIIGIVLLSDFPIFLKYKKGDIKDFETVAAHELKKGDLVQGTIDFTDGCIAEMETSRKTMGITTSKYTSSRYYAVYMYNEDYILYETGDKSQYDTLDSLADECQQYYSDLQSVYGEEGSGDVTEVMQPTTTLEFTGVVKPLESDLSAIFEEWYGEGYEDECEMFVIVNRKFGNLGSTLIGGAAVVLVGIALLVLTVIIWRREKNADNYGF